MFCSDNAALDDLEVKQRYLPKSGRVPISSTLLAFLATPISSARLLTGNKASSRYKYMHLGQLRHTHASHMMTRGHYTRSTELKHDPAWNNLETFLAALAPEGYRMVEWEAPLLGCLAGCLYAVTPDGICVTNDPEEETIFELKSGSKPSGIQQLRRWSNDYKTISGFTPCNACTSNQPPGCCTWDGANSAWTGCETVCLEADLWLSPQEWGWSIHSSYNVRVYLDADIDIGRHRRRHTIRH